VERVEAGGDRFLAWLLMPLLALQRVSRIVQTGRARGYFG
jgi:hypothetical protein